MTAVEWLVEQIKEQHPFWTDIFKQAKQMEKEQIIEATYASPKTGEDYYNETYEK